MTELLTLPLPPEARAAMAAIPGTHTSQIMSGTQHGPDRHLGPEKAGAILMLQATFTSPDGFAAFWTALVPLSELLQAAPGFTRRYCFADGPHWTLIALRRTADDARAFAARPEHRAAVRDLDRQRWQDSHFTAIWEMTANHDRVIFCPSCQAVTPATNQQCRVRHRTARRLPSAQRGASIDRHQSRGGSWPSSGRSTPAPSRAWSTGFSWPAGQARRPGSE